MSISVQQASLTILADPEKASTQDVDDAFARMLSDDESAEDMLAAITSDGLRSWMSWRIEQLKKKIAGEVMAAKGLSEKDIAAMAPEQRASVEKQIMEEVEAQLKQAMEEEMKRQKKDQLAIIRPFDRESFAALLQVQEA